jgi:hypothetical protein
VTAGHSAADATILFSHIQDLRGSRIVCLPFSDYCDPLIEGINAWSALVAPLLAFNAPVRLRCLRNTLPDDDARFTLFKRARWHAVDLADTASVVRLQYPNVTPWLALDATKVVTDRYLAALREFALDDTQPPVLTALFLLEEPVSPKPWRAAAVGAAIGMLLAAAGAIMWARPWRTIRQT